MEKTNYVGNITGSFVANVNVTNGSEANAQNSPKQIKRRELTLSWVSLIVASVSLVTSISCISLVHTVSLSSAWPGFVLGVLAILTTVLLGFQIKSVIDIDSKLTEQQNRLGDFVASQSEKYILPNLKIVNLQIAAAKLSTLTRTWNERCEVIGEREFMFRSTFECCYLCVRRIILDSHVSIHIKEEVPSVCVDALTSLSAAKKYGIIDEEFLVNQKQQIEYLISFVPTNYKKYFEELIS